MIESIYPSSEKSGLPPGSLVHIGEVIDTDISLSIIDYGKEKFESKKIDSIDEIIKHKNSQEMTWLIVEGLKNTETVERIGQVFGIHQLVLEDILNTNQRPKFEEYDDHLYIVLKCLLPAVDQFRVNYEQISLLVMNNFVVMFKEKQDTLFDPLQLRIKNSTGKFRGLGSDYLAYTILDYIVDQNFIILDSLDETVNSLEDRLLTDEPTNEMVSDLLEEAPVFIKQLDLVGVDINLKTRAAGDYLWASSDKTRWAEEGFVFEHSLDEYDDGLIRRHSLISAELSITQKEKVDKDRGQLLYLECCKGPSEKLQDLAVPGHFLTGSLNDLANRRKIGWHPSFKSLLLEDD